MNDDISSHLFCPNTRASCGRSCCLDCAGQYTPNKNPQHNSTSKHLRAWKCFPLRHTAPNSTTISHPPSTSSTCPSATANHRNHNAYLISLSTIGSTPPSSLLLPALANRCRAKRYALHQPASATIMIMIAFRRVNNVDGLMLCVMRTCRCLMRSRCAATEQRIDHACKSDILIRT